jgi:hypothetical protein
LLQRPLAWFNIDVTKKSRWLVTCDSVEQQCCLTGDL